MTQRSEPYRTNKEEFIAAIETQIEIESTTQAKLVSNLLNPCRYEATADKLDEATTWIQLILKKAAAKSVLEQRTCKRSKPCWNLELSEAYKELRDTRTILHRWMRDFHIPSIVLADRVKEKWKNTLRLVRRAKSEYYWKMVEEANTHSIWTYRKWTKNTRTYTAPPIEWENHPPAISHTDKCEMLREHLFLEPPTLAE